MDAEPEAPFDGGRARPEVLPEAGALLELRLPLERAPSALPRPVPRALLGRSEPGRAVVAGRDAGAGDDVACDDGACDDGACDDGACDDRALRAGPTDVGCAEPIGATSRRMRSNSSSPLAISGAS